MKNRGALAVIVILLIIVIVTLFTYFMFNYYKDQGKFDEKSSAIEPAEMNVNQTIDVSF